ncbi:radical SAM protein [Phaeobacter sp. QD34_3]|uniref:radical SAM protein n=1 Tax=unclassified Phaeobacter TaxID=2621772 RepID=UPI00237F9656|nr:MULTISPECIES: radical SAM protein [unclassified Phaeobacter]MDE4133249.1 radical SAM protein [Phaeobacter sp. QD34_3]MDE4136964.1 radical SAM protein [Phaeobacter sp. QD34_24]
MTAPLDCLVIGYNEPATATHAAALARMGKTSPAYRDLALSVIEGEGGARSYMDLLDQFRPAGSPPMRCGAIPNLAAVYLVNMLQNSGLSADWINLFQDEKDRLAMQLAQGVRCVAITTTFYVTNAPVHEIVAFIRARSDARIVLGGPLVTNHLRNSQTPEELAVALGDLGADIYVADPEGESTLCRLTRTLAEAGDLYQVPNLIFADGSRTLIAPEENPMDQRVIDWRRFAPARLGPVVQTRTARSCAFNCSFCSYPIRAGALALTSVERVIEELQALAALGVRQLVFIDDTFNVPLPRFKALCRAMIKRDWGFEWYSYLRCSNLDEEAIALMVEAGCGGVFLGIESGSPAILKAMNKSARTKHYRRGIKALKQAGVLTFASFILGFPGETEETVAETLAFLDETAPDYYRIQPWYSEPGAPIEAQRERYGITGGGFAWRHATMDSATALDLIEEAFMEERSALWLPQWSFDFWSIPYLRGRGMSFGDLKGFMRRANALHRQQFQMQSQAAAQRAHRDALADLRLHTSEVLA